MTEPRPKAQAIDAEDVDDIIGLAASAKESDEGKLTVDEVRAIAEDVQIPARFVEPAIEELARKKAHAEEEARARAARTKRLVRLAAGAGLATIALLALGAVVGAKTRAGLAEHVAEVEARRAQVVNVLERQRATEALYRDRPPALDRDAELSGAENRVRIERRRYDEAAASYNAEAAGLVASLFCASPSAPCSVPLSHEVDAW